MASRTRRIMAVLAARGLKAVFGARLGMAPRAARRSAVALQTRLAFEELGGTFIKIGQIISVRPDVFPAELIFELEKLRDSVPPVSCEAIREVIVAEFGRPPEEMFVSFDPSPMASASIAQVHRAILKEEARPAWGETLPPGTEVAVKVIKPGVEEAIWADLEAARRFLGRLKKLGLMRRINSDNLLDQTEASLHRELDMRVEGRAADRFAFNFRGDGDIVVPRVVWKRTGRRVLTMEYLRGWPLSAMAAAAAAGVNTKTLALRGAEAFMKQVLEDGLFHADLHHANLLATADSRIAYLDFGIFGTLSDRERENVAQVLAALAYRDVDRALKYSAGLGVEIKPGKVGAMKEELGRLMDRTLKGEGGAGKDVKNFGVGFMSLLDRYSVDIPVGYSLLVKALVTVEGVSRELYPDIDIIETAKPFVTRVLARAILNPDRLRERLPAALNAAAAQIIA